MAIWLIGMQLYFLRRFYYQESGLQRDLVCNFITRSQQATKPPLCSLACLFRTGYLTDTGKCALPVVG